MTERNDARRPGHSARILVFAATEGYRHTSIPAAVAALARLGARHGFEVHATEDPAYHGDDLDGFDAVVWVSVTGTVLDEAQRASLQRYVENGGGFVGIHGASAAEPDWPFFETLIGSRFASHPAPCVGTVLPTAVPDPSTAAFAPAWTHLDEWYRFERPLDEDVEVLAVLAEGEVHHPLVWRRRIGAGQSWYTALGHFEDTYSDPRFEAHLLGGLRSASGGTLS